jgi:DNA mismatch repair protein MSH5
MNSAKELGPQARVPIPLAILHEFTLTRPFNLFLAARILHLLDLFGISDGAGLFCGVIKHFLRRGADCPKVLAVTHFHDIFRPDLLDVSLPITFLHMDIMFTSSSGESLRRGSDMTSDSDGKCDTSGPSTVDSITYLYRQVIASV